LFGKNFCVLAAAAGRTLCDAACKAAADVGLPLDAYRVAQGENVSDPEGRFADAYGLSPSGAVIVPPDGFVAWRAKDTSGKSKATMSTVLLSLLCRNGEARPSVRDT
jgi:putative polyketide hydroxylase